MGVSAFCVRNGTLTGVGSHSGSFLRRYRCLAFEIRENAVIYTASTRRMDARTRGLLS